ncbi:MAG: hypothetical protein CFE43_10700 [Burkholderiales bacterium PBB3]|nr:MAG: hypothetical protein CFE43_10700 [Burkholderiales bacterium PBB3]
MPAMQVPPKLAAPQSTRFASASVPALERYQLLWLAAGITLVSGCLVALALAYLRVQAIETGEDLTQSFAQVIEEQTTRTFQSVDQSLEITANNLAQMQRTGTLNEVSARQLLRQELKSMPFARVLWVTDAQGRLVYDTQVVRSDTDLSDTGYFKTLLAQPDAGFLISAPVKTTRDGLWLIPAARPLIAADGDFGGAIVALIDPRYFETRWKSIDLGDDGSVTLFRRDGVLMMRGPFDEASMGKSFQNLRVFKELLPESPSGNFTNTSSIDGVNRMLSYRTLSAQPELVVVVGQSYERVLTPWRSLTTLAIAIWLVAAAGITLLCLFLHRARQQKATAQAQAAQLAERLRMATDAAEIGVWDWDIAQADQWYASPTYFSMLGYDPQEGFANRLQWVERLHPDDRPGVEARIQAVLEGDHLPYQYEARMQHADGSYRWISVVGRVLARDTHGKATRMMGIRLDITERKLAEEKLRLSEENLAITLQSIGDAVIVTDASGNINRMNPTAERLTGWTLPQALGNPLTDVFQIINAQTRLPAVNPVHLVMEKGEVVGLANHTALLARDGHEYQIFDSAAPIRDRNGQIVGVVLVFSDVTEQYRVREQLATSAQLLERTGEMAKIGGWEVDLRSMQLTWSRQTYHLHEVDPATQPTLQQSMELVTPEARPTVQAALQDATTTGNPWDMEVQLMTTQGRRFWARLQGRVEMENGKPIRLLGATQVITERKQAEDALRESAEHMQTILDNMVDGVLTINTQGVVESFNRAASTIFGCAPEEIIGRNASVLIEDPDQHYEEDYLRHRFSTDGAGIASISREVHGKHKDGSLFPIHLSLSKISRNGQTTLIGIVRDITQQRHDEDEIRRLAFYDPLTGLPNRRLLMDRLKQAIVTSARAGKHGALMFLDLDHFKLLNDTQGHDMGDVLLQQVAQRLQACVRDGDSVARLGGDEFVVLLEALSPHSHEAATQAEAIASKLLDAFVQPYTLHNITYACTTSIGIVVFRGDDEAMDDLLKKADLAMYQGKSAGRNTARFFDPAMQAAVAAHDAMEKDLHRGLALQEFVLHYQIQVNGQGQTIGAEALVRWQHIDKGLVTPIHFIGLAEQTGLILPLGQWVLEQACAQLVAWSHQSATAHWTLAVNVSASQFSQADFIANVSRALQDTGANPRLLKLELTESILVHDVEDVIVKITAIKALGVGFSLDDFGTGYSSLSYLKRLPLDQLKIDQSFVRDVLTDPSDAVIARTIVALGHSLGLTVIAEGVEPEGQREMLASMGCDAFQGYYFGRPSAPDALG